jgi:hypothetical protein
MILYWFGNQKNSIKQENVSFITKTSKSTLKITKLVLTNPQLFWSGLDNERLLTPPSGANKRR